MFITYVLINAQATLQDPNVDMTNYRYLLKDIEEYIYMLCGAPLTPPAHVVFTTESPGMKKYWNPCILQQRTSSIHQLKM